MRRSILIFALCSLFYVPTFAQEAFYIYANDGKFRGFFYDEVEELRLSKIGLDSVEYDEYVVQEVVLADTVHRIALSTIDSIGFQQPEIKINPNVKFIQEGGLAPYLVSVGEDNMGLENLPGNLMPKVGEIWIGLTTDSCNALYSEMGGSFALVVEGVYTYGTYTSVMGRPVEDLGEVFEQFITVEKIGVDSAGHVIRRIAGCTPDGMPRRAPQASGSTDDVTILNIDGNLHKEIEFSSNVKFDLSAETNLQVRLRASYYITAFHFNVTLTNDNVLAVKPSIGLSVSRSFTWEPEDLWPLPFAIVFPAACPIFETNPIPVFFIRGSGTLEARFNMPKVGLGVGIDYFIDSWNFPPISASLHYVPQDDEEITADMLDKHGEVKVSGMLQMGILFKARINTASWFKKILQCGIGVNLYCGPKIDGAFSYNFNTKPEEMDYELLSNGYLASSLLSVGLEASAKTKIGWKDPDQVTFFDKSFDFGTDTVRLALPFEETTVEQGYNDAVSITLHPHSGVSLFYPLAEVGIFDGGSDEPFATLGHFDIGVVEPETELHATWNLNNTIKSRGYTIMPLVYGAGAMLKPFEVQNAAVGFTPQMTLSLNQRSISFSENVNEYPSITFNSNMWKGDQVWCNGENGALGLVDSFWVDTLDYNAGIYKMSFRGNKKRLFPLPTIPADHVLAPFIQINSTWDGPKYAMQKFGVTSSLYSTPEITIRVGGYVVGKGELTLDFETSKIERVDPNTIRCSDSDTRTYEAGYITKTVDVTITKDEQAYWEDLSRFYLDHFRASGTITYKRVHDGKTTNESKIVFNNIKGEGTSADGELTSATATIWECIQQTSDGSCEKTGYVTYTLNAGDESHAHISILNADYE